MIEAIMMIVASFGCLVAFFWILSKKDEDLQRWIWGDNYEYLIAMIEKKNFPPDSQA